MVDQKNQKIPIWRDERFWRIALQVLAVVIFVGIAALLIGNLNRNLAQQGNNLGFGFLKNEAGFSISETLISYKPKDPYSQVLLAGLVNSLRVMILGIIFTTIVGILAGIASFSENWLLRQLNRIYVEVVRNTPLLLQLFFWYFVVFFSLPKPENKIELLGSIFMSKRGIAIPWPANTVTVWLGLLVLGMGGVVAVFIWRWRNQLMTEKAQSGQPQLIALIMMAIVSILIIIFALGWQAPKALATGGTEGGLNLTLELSALLVGLVFYTGAFIAEIVRAGIQSVPKGQWEAAKSLGLKSGLVIRLVIFPQALRVMIPSLNSQYMNLAKNSSLAIAIGYPDLYAVSNTTYNQTGRPVEVFILIMAAYLSINLIISLSMNLLNKTVQIKER
ncbi:MAG: ABC transporter permease subunit [Gomphosphaeria aponina SAG 52.96 = DSM 107014]|uniref:ABC transporter permease subunit n=1 Tax=Gomphosphaeria aponina SAG 52.96 = DSM 107014 TaxID=1521640 RepID=A0A941GTC7_9CHRO|nr:ABC transporter permease subunit [Gomphosphaeria aponina SAG 52.96 = DSM 107014]